MTLPPLRLTQALADAANESWGFNCGPASICAVTGKTPDEIRPHLGDFERKRYTNPTLMFAALTSLGVKYARGPKSVTLRHLALGEFDVPDWPSFGLARIQWDGPWCAPGVPPAAAYRHTHWVAAASDPTRGVGVFDVNSFGNVAGGWTTLDGWSTELVPWLLKQCEPKATGKWWITHSLEIAGGVR